MCNGSCRQTSAPQVANKSEKRLGVFSFPTTELARLTHLSAIVVVDYVCVYFNVSVRDIFVNVSSGRSMPAKTHISWSSYVV